MTNQLPAIAGRAALPHLHAKPLKTGACPLGWAWGPGLTPGFASPCCCVSWAKIFSSLDLSLPIFPVGLGRGA